MTPGEIIGTIAAFTAVIGLMTFACVRIVRLKNKVFKK
jgi:hypothetical protein